MSKSTSCYNVRGGPTCQKRMKQLRNQNSESRQSRLSERGKSEGSSSDSDLEYKESGSERSGPGPCFSQLSRLSYVAHFWKHDAIGTMKVNSVISTASRTMAKMSETAEIPAPATTFDRTCYDVYFWKHGAIGTLKIDKSKAGITTGEANRPVLARTRKLPHFPIIVTIQECSTEGWQQSSHRTLTVTLSNAGTSSMRLLPTMCYVVHLWKHGKIGTAKIDMSRAGIITIESNQCPFSQVPPERQMGQY